MKVTKNCKLTPLQTGISAYGEHRKYFETVLVTIENYPSALMHIDTFYEKVDDVINSIYLHLDKGLTVTGKITFEVDD